VNEEALAHWEVVGGRGGLLRQIKKKKPELGDWYIVPSIHFQSPTF